MNKVDIIKEAIYKVAKDNETKFWKDRFVPALKAGAGEIAGGAAGSAIPIAMGKGKGAIAAGAVLGGVTGGATVNAVRLKNLHKNKLGTNPSGKDYAKTILTNTVGGALAPVTGGVTGLVAPFINTPEAIVKSKLRQKQANIDDIVDEIYKVAEDNEKKAPNNFRAIAERFGGGMLGGAGGAVVGATAGILAANILQSPTALLPTVGGIIGGGIGINKGVDKVIAVQKNRLNNKQANIDDIVDEIYKVAFFTESSTRAALKATKGILKDVRASHAGALKEIGSLSEKNNVLKKGNKMLKGISTVGVGAGVAGGGYGAYQKEQNDKIRGGY